MQIKTIIRYNLSIIKKQKITNVGKEVEKLETLCTAGVNVKWCNHYGKQHGCSSKSEK